jgi:hypothetical protein
MPTQLENLELTELSFVDRPANPLAKIAIAKRDNSQDEPEAQPVKKQESIMTFEQHVADFTKAGLSPNEALFKARVAYPREFSKWQNAPVHVPARIEKSESVARAERAIQKRADEIRSAEKLPHHIAFSKAAAEMPEELAILRA